MTRANKAAIIAGIAGVLMTAGVAQATGCPGSNKWVWEYPTVEGAQAALAAAGSAGLPAKYVVRSDQGCYVALTTTCTASWGSSSVAYQFQSNNRVPTGAVGACNTRVHLSTGAAYGKPVYFGDGWTWERQ